ncbi:MAG: hypothetical protein SWY16_03590 [Cyanobacteriota bacterium]|nr:hypothetical protein [Cyanobacteriota bacterium]
MGIFSEEETEHWLRNPGLAIWVTESSLYKNSPRSWIVDGTAIDGNRGFGHERPRYFDGKAVLLTPEKKFVEKEFSIGEIHFSRAGFKWVIERASPLPPPPFLVSSDEKIQMIFNGEAEVVEDPGEVDFFDTEDFYCYPMPIGTRNWFGVWAIKGNKKVHLVAFSSNKDAKIAEDEQLWSFEWECFLGRIRAI